MELSQYNQFSSGDDVFSDGDVLDEFCTDDELELKEDGFDCVWHFDAKDNGERAESACKKLTERGIEARIVKIGDSTSRRIWTNPKSLNL